MDVGFGPDARVNLRISPVVFYKLRNLLYKMAEDPADPRCYVCSESIDFPGQEHKDCKFLNK